MSGPQFEPPPRIIPALDKDGYIRLTQRDWDTLIAWLERYMKFVAQEYD